MVRKRAEFQRSYDFRKDMENGGRNAVFRQGAKIGHNDRSCGMDVSPSTASSKPGKW